MLKWFIIIFFCCCCCCANYSIQINRIWLFHLIKIFLHFFVAVVVFLGKLDKNLADSNSNLCYYCLKTTTSFKIVIFIDCLFDLQNKRNPQSRIKSLSKLFFLFKNSQENFLSNKLKKLVSTTWLNEFRRRTIKKKIEKRCIENDKKYLTTTKIT